MDADGRHWPGGVAALHLPCGFFRGTVGAVLITEISMRALLSMIRRSGFAAFGCAMLGLLAASPAQAANPLELNFWLSGPRYDGALPACESALKVIASQFAEKESTFWNSALQITGYEHVREVAFRPWTSNNIPRRFCTARAHVNDGKIRPVHYSIIEDGGIAAFSDGVEWCVVGLDRNWAFNPACKAARP